MIRKLTISVLFILMLMSTALARIEASPVKVDQYGMEPAMWLAIVVGFGAIIQHTGRYLQKKSKNPGMEYDPAYLYTTVMSSIALCQMTAAIPVAELTIPAIGYAFASGLGITEGVNKITKVKQ